MNFALDSFAFTHQKLKKGNISIDTDIADIVGLCVCAFVKNRKV